MSWKPGQSGNPSGRKRGNWRTHFDAALKADTAKHKQSLFEHAIKEARKDNTLLAAILRKCLPDLKSIEAKADGERPIRLLITLPGDERAGRKAVVATEAEDQNGLPDAPVDVSAPPVLPPVMPVASETECKQASKHPAT